MQNIWQAGFKTIVQFTPSGFGLGVTAHALLNHQWTQAILLSFATGITSLWVKFSGKFMEEAEKEAAKRGGSFAQWLFTLFDKLTNAFYNHITQFYWEVTSDFEGKYFKRLQYICRNFETQGLDKDRVLKLEQVFVPLQISQKSLAQVSPNLLRRIKDCVEESGPTQMGNFLSLMAKDTAFRRLAILGAPGSGKTTLMRHVTLMYANRQQRLLHPNAPRLIPVLLYLRDIHLNILQNPQISLADLLTTWAENLQQTDRLKPPAGWFAKQLQHNRVLVLLDGLDEVADDRQRQQVSAWVDRQMYEYPDAYFVLTSRLFGYETAKLQQDVAVLEVEPFRQAEIRQFVHSWYLATEIRSQEGEVDSGVREEATRQADALLAEIETRPALAELATNPLLLSMIATVHRRGYSLPRKRVELYREICQVLLEKRQRAKAASTRGALPPPLSEPTLTASQKQLVLQPLALDLTRRETLKFTAETAYPILEAKLKMLPGSPFTPETFLRQLRDVDALIAKEQEGVYEFAHRSFQEYFTAVEIKATQQESRLVEILQTPDKLEWWAETLRLYAAQTDATQLIQTVLNNPSFETLLLACDFWQEGQTTQPNVQQALQAKLNEVLKGLEPSLFNYAAQVQPRYFKLGYYLQTGQWEKADYETYRVMKTVGDRNQKGYLSPEDIAHFPCEDLRVIDQLWVNSSKGHFGFSVQKEIYLQCGGIPDGKYHEKAWDKFCHANGWKVNNQYESVKYNTSSPRGHLPMCDGWGGRWGSLLSHPNL